LLQKLRENNLATEMDFGNRSLKAQISQADRLGAACVIIIGEMELRDGKAQVRDMATAYQQPVPFNEVPDHVKLLKDKTLAETNV